MTSKNQLFLIIVLLLLIGSARGQGCGYSNYSESWNWAEFVTTPAGGGGGVSVDIVCNQLTVQFSAGFTQSSLKTGHIVRIESNPTLPNMVLGSLGVGDYVVSISGGFLHVNGFGTVGGFGKTFTVLLTSTGPNPAQKLLENYVEQTSVLVSGHKDPDQLATLSRSKRNRSVSYYDGLGRIFQSIKLEHSPGGHNELVNIAYDGAGNAIEQTLPYVINKAESLPLQDANNRTINFYNSADYVARTDLPFVPVLHEKSPLHRVVKQGAAGEDWQIDPDPTVRTDKVVHHSYGVNSQADKVIHWQIDAFTDRLSCGEFYSTGKLAKTVTTDEEGHSIISFTNNLGHTVLKRVQAKKNPNDTNYQLGEWADTYYIYDYFDHLRYVLPPEAIRTINGPPNFTYIPGDDLLAEWAFQYQFDHRQRMVEKQVPGAAPIYMVYDKRDRLVLTQDGNQRDPLVTTGREWTFFKYDVLNRPIATGIYVHASAVDQENMQLEVDRHYQGALPGTLYEDFLGTGSHHGYTNQSYPTGVVAEDYLTVSYYDNYAFQSMFGTGYSYEKPVVSTNYRNTAFDKVKGQVTGTKVKILGTDQWINTVTHYDDRYRVIQTVSTNEYLGVNTRTSQLYNFPGWLLETYKSQTRGSKTLGLRQRYSYDHAGRLLRGYHELYDDGVGQGEVLLAENRYNELGELIEKNLHVEGGVPAQSIDYRYNIRGWLENINNAQLTHDPRNDDSNDLFGMELIYESPLNGVPPVGN